MVFFRLSEVLIGIGMTKMEVKEKLEELLTLEVGIMNQEDLLLMLFGPLEVQMFTDWVIKAKLT